MVVQHIILNAAQGVDRRRYLMNSIQTLALVFDHFLQTAHLTFDAPKTRLLPIVGDFDSAVVVFI